MGIVVCVALMVSVFCVWGERRSLIEPSLLNRQRSVVAVFVLLVGVWNVFWYGLRNTDTFWGQAAIVSGAFLMIAAVQIMADKYASFSPLINNIGDALFNIRYVTLAGLVLSALLYLVTLIQLNLGFEIIR